jgi:hypothetical protein
MDVIFKLVFNIKTESGNKWKVKFIKICESYAGPIEHRCEMNSNGNYLYSEDAGSDQWVEDAIKGWCHQFKLVKNYVDNKSKELTIRD